MFYVLNGAKILLNTKRFSLNGNSLVQEDEMVIVPRYGDFKDSKILKKKKGKEKTVRSYHTQEKFIEQ